jgi:hypothetical protein
MFDLFQIVLGQLTAQRITGAGIVSLIKAKYLNKAKVNCPSAAASPVDALVIQPAHLVMGTLALFFTKSSFSTVNIDVN